MMNKNGNEYIHVKEVKKNARSVFWPITWLKQVLPVSEEGNINRE